MSDTSSPRPLDHWIHTDAPTSIKEYWSRVSQETEPKEQYEQWINLFKALVEELRMYAEGAYAHQRSRGGDHGGADEKIEAKLREIIEETGGHESLGFALYRLKLTWKCVPQPSGNDPLMNRERAPEGPRVDLIHSWVLIKRIWRDSDVQISGSMVSKFLPTFKEAHPLEKGQKSASVFNVLETLLNIRNAEAHAEKFKLGKNDEGEVVERALNLDQAYYALITPLIEGALRDALQLLCDHPAFFRPALEVVSFEETQAGKTMLVKCLHGVGAQHKVPCPDDPPELGSWWCYAQEDDAWTLLYPLQREVLHPLPAAPDEPADDATEYEPEDEPETAPSSAGTTSYISSTTPQKRFQQRRPRWVPYRSKGEHFVGRQSEMALIETRLQERGALGHIASLQGLGGMGKTQLAVEFADRHGPSYRDGVIWFHAQEARDTQLALFAQEGLGHLEGRLEHLVGLGRLYLREHDQYLLILDDVESEAQLGQWLELFPEQHPHILITSRERLPSVSPIGIPPLSIEESVQLLRHMSHRGPNHPRGEESKLTELAELLEGYSLSLELAGAYLGEAEDLEVEDYIAHIKRQELNAEGLDRDGTRRYTEHEASVRRTFLVELERLRADYPELLSVLQVLAFWRGSTAPLPMIKRLEIPGCHLDDPIKRSKILRFATQRSVLKRGDDQQGAHYSMHNFLRAFFRDTVPDTPHVQLLCLAEGIRRWLESDWREEALAPVATYERELLDLADALLTFEAQVGAQGLACSTFLRGVVARARYLQGDAKGALRLLDQGESGVAQMGPRMRGRYLLTRVMARRQLADYQGLFELLEEAESLLAEAKDVPLGERVRVYLVGAELAHDLGKYEMRSTQLNRGREVALQAEDTPWELQLIEIEQAKSKVQPQECLNRVRDSYESLRAQLGDHPEVYRALLALSASLEYIGQFEDALTSAQEAQARLLSIYQDTHPIISNAFMLIGSTLGSLGKHEEALELEQKALDLRLKIFGEEHPDVANSYKALGSTLSSLGRYHEALKLKEKALEIALRTFGEQHLAVASYYTHIGISLDEMFRHDEAFDNHSMALNIALNSLGDYHPSISSYYGNMGSNLRYLGRYQEALDYQIKSLELELAIFGDEHIAIAISYDNIAGTLIKLGRYEEAINFQKEALNLELNILGPKHPDVATTYNNIGVSYQHTNNYIQMHRYAKKSYQLRCELLNEAHKNTIISLRGYLLSLAYLKQYQNVMSVLEVHQSRLAKLDLSSSMNFEAVGKLRAVENEIIGLCFPNMINRNKNTSKSRKKMSKSRRKRRR